MIRKIWKERWVIAFLLLLLLYFIFLNYKINYLMGYDEARHAVQGHFFYDYFRTILSRDVMSLGTFLSLYMQRGYNIGWNALYDPPLHAIAQALTFIFLGASAYTARLATMLIVLAGSFLVYLFALRVLKSKLLAVTVVFLYLLCPLVYEFARESRPDAASSFLMVGWFYFFFKPGRYFSLVFSRRLKLRLGLNIMASALFLTGATLMRYQNLIFSTLFIAVYFCLLVAKDFRTRVGFWDSRALGIFRDYAVVMIIFLLLGGWWLKFSLIDNNMLQRVFFEGMQRQTGTNHFFYLAETAKMTYFAALFAFVPIIGWLRNRRDSFLSQNWQLLLFVLVSFIFATFFITNQQLRYMIAALPFLFVLIVQGIYEAASFLHQLIRAIEPRYFSVAIALVFAVLYVMHDRNLADRKLFESGMENSEIRDFIMSAQDPKLLVYIKGGGVRSVNYMNTPDLFVFRAMTARRESDPNRMKQLVDMKFWEGDLEYNTAAYIQWLNQTSSNIPTYVFVFRYEPESPLLGAMSRLLPAIGFASKNLTYYTVFERK